MKRYGLIILFLTFFAFWLPDSQASESDKTAIVWGEAVIYNENKPQAKERALQEAFSAAIAQVMGSYITAESYTQNYVSIDRSVLSRTKGYVKTYEILEVKEMPDMLSLKVTAVISSKSIKDDLTALGILLDALGNPTVEISGDDEGLEMSESIPVFKRMFSAKGFYTVEKNSENPPDVAIHVNGKVTNRTVMNGTGFHGAVVAVTARAVRSSTGSLIASESAVSNGAGLNNSAALKQAYQQAAESLVPKLVEAVSEKWGRELAEGKTLSLTVKAGAYDKVQQFTKHLNRIFGVKKVDMKSFGNGEAKYLVRFAGKSRTLADLILKMPIDTVSVSVGAFDSDSIILTLK